MGDRPGSAAPGHFFFAPAVDRGGAGSTLGRTQERRPPMAKIPTGRFVWFEYSSKDPSKAQAFFGELFGWKTKEMQGGPSPYTMIAVGEDTIGGYWPAPPPGAPQNAHWITHLQVEDATESAAKVKQLGGSVKMEPMK